MTIIANQQSYKFAIIVVIIIFWSTTIQKSSSINLQIPRLYTVCMKLYFEFVFVLLGGGRCGGGSEIERSVHCLLESKIFNKRFMSPYFR